MVEGTANKMATLRETLCHTTSACHICYEPVARARQRYSEKVGHAGRPRPHNLTRPQTNRHSPTNLRTRKTGSLPQ